MRMPVSSLFLLLALAAPRGASGQQPTPAPSEREARLLSTGVDPALAVATFDSAWSQIERTWFDTTFGGLDWRGVRAELRPRAERAATMRELRDAIDEMLGRLGMSHFVLIPRELLAGDRERDRATGDVDGDAGVEVRAIGASLHVWRVRAGGAADRAGVGPGWIVDSIGSLDVGVMLRAAERTGTMRERRLLRISALSRAHRALTGAVGDTVMLHARDARGTAARRVLILTEAPGTLLRFGSLPPMRAVVESERVALLGTGGGCAGVVRLSVWLPATMPRLLAGLDSVRHCRGIIFDLRGNPGGVAGMPMGVGGYFLDEPVSLGTMRTRTGELRLTVNPRRATATGEPARPTDRPLVILVDEMSASTSEIFAGAMQALRRATVIGDTTAGQALPAMVYSLPTGDVLMYAFADFTAPDGARLEGRGVIPDVVTPLRRADLLARRDAALEAAIAHIAAAAG